MVAIDQPNCRENAIDAHFAQKGWLWTATTPAHVDSWDGTLKACAALGVTQRARAMTRTTFRGLWLKVGRHGTSTGADDPGACEPRRGSRM
ncbi:hypothetical protein DPM13_07885 [Paracoccus mutanolyticus]|uniref:Transposase DDE domain-containing protein n=1 Tax=Paracoccus mutanolyticus TaxID=1499308 RepID=A0ABM6WR50_9RHOB|nr:hypothetical protein [Paracoccus mutanolyticus]AWX93096.1 hypothetical protein DPM13_07885 [Paracoccus mutanolyticus]